MNINTLKRSYKTFLTAGILGILLIVGVAGLTQKDTANALTEQKDHVIKFYIDPSLVPDMDFAKQVLPKYVQDMNAILAKNTNRHLSFDPASGIILTSTKPYSGSVVGPLPTQNYEVWAHVSPTDASYPYSNSGNMSFDSSGAAVLGGLKWLKLYDPDTLSADTPDMRDYWIQIDHMLHEYAHVYGAGLGEYYSLGTVSDTTGEAPLLNISLFNPADSFWSRHPDFMYDPLLANIYGEARVGSPVSRSALLGLVRYSNLTATIMNGDYRTPTAYPPAADLQNLTLKLTDSNNGAPVSGATVKIWEVRATAGNYSSLLLNTTSNTSGDVNFAWGGSSNPHNNYDMLRLIKVYAPGYMARAYYLSIYDTDEARLLRGESTFTLPLQLTKGNQPPSVTITNPTANQIVSPNTNVLIQANASDDTGIAKVEFSVDGALKCTDTSVPYTCTWKVPAKKGKTYTITAKAYDTAGAAATTTVNVST
ncbi:MAG: Ig-like domain-containing protein [Candidatus Saccharimonadales bacterium]